MIQMLLDTNVDIYQKCILMSFISFTQVMQVQWIPLMIFKEYCKKNAIWFTMLQCNVYHIQWCLPASNLQCSIYICFLDFSLFIKQTWRVCTKYHSNLWINIYIWTQLGPIIWLKLDINLSSKDCNYHCIVYHHWLWCCCGFVGEVTNDSWF